jgi:uncharacterized protein
MLTDNINRFSTPVIRDLVWAIASPPLLKLDGTACRWPDSQWYRQQFEQRMDWLLLQDRQPEMLLQLVASRKDRRLGKYFETLWFYWLDHHPRYRVLHHNLQIVIEGETIGEMDFIVQDKETNEVIHLELAVKSYLGTGQLEVPANWYGPHRKDRLDIKLAHLLDRQTKIGQRPVVRQWLAERGIRIDRCVVILKGRLYYPVETVGQSAGQLVDPEQKLVTRTNCPDDCVSDHLRGQWIHRGQLLLASDPDARFLPLINSGWMADLLPYDNANYFDISDIYKIDSKKSLRLPLHVMSVNSCLFKEKLFIVDDDWGVEDD